MQQTRLTLSILSLMMLPLATTALATDPGSTDEVSTNIPIQLSPVASQNYLRYLSWPETGYVAASADGRVIKNSFCAQTHACGQDAETVALSGCKAKSGAAACTIIYTPAGQTHAIRLHPQAAFLNAGYRPMRYELERGTQLSSGWMAWRGTHNGAPHDYEIVLDSADGQGRCIGTSKRITKADNWAYDMTCSTGPDFEISTQYDHDTSIESGIGLDEAGQAIHLSLFKLQD
ncbi:hypothetical protein GCM10007854_22450 [Algimonas porphyrae]|uniref:Uncharacterized protein n=1 Tax=Algimonas porphyrae TaxID=1128113 RepID=A0ABQ5V3P1_9PROT|nr:hypothetical protein GCM10007854_22450 [Algimonas porphyrae]